MDGAVVQQTPGQVQPAACFLFFFQSYELRMISILSKDCLKNENKYVAETPVAHQFLKCLLPSPSHSRADLCWCMLTSARRLLVGWRCLSFILYHPVQFSFLHYVLVFSSVQSLSRVRLFAAPWPAAHQAPLSIINSWSLLKLMSFELVMPSNRLILCHPLLLPSIFPSIRVFSSESVLCICCTRLVIFQPPIPHPKFAP